MSDNVEYILRTAGGYDLAKQTLSLMERHRVLPTALNFKVWLERAAHPQGDLAAEIGRLTDERLDISEAAMGDLAKQFLPGFDNAESYAQLGAEIELALKPIIEAINSSNESNAIYIQQLESANARIGQLPRSNSLRDLLSGVFTATKIIHDQNNALSSKIDVSKREIAKLKKELNNVEVNLQTDALTELANRKAFDQNLDRACADAESIGQPVALAMIDIDHFKKFNDTWGHQTGDQVIRYVASVIGRVGSGIALSARYGGEEFTVIFPSNPISLVVTELEKARQEIASRSLKRRATHEDLGAVTISIGVADRLKGESAVRLIARADAALYQSKLNGRNRLTVAAGAGAMDTVSSTRAKAG